MSSRVNGAKSLPRPVTARPPDPTSQAIAAAAAHDLTVRVPTQGGTRMLAPADLKRIAANPALLQSEYHATLDAEHLAAELGGTSAWASMGAQVDLVAEARHNDFSAAPPDAATDGALAPKDGAQNAASPLNWTQLDDLAARLAGAAQSGATPGAEATYDADLWRGVAAGLGAAGGAALRTMISDPKRRKSVAARWTRRLKEVPSIPRTEVAGTAAALVAQLAEIYARLPRVRLRRLQPLLAGPALTTASRRLVGQVLDDTAFGALSLGQQQRLLRVVDGSDRRFSWPIQSGLRTLMTSASYQAMAAPARARAIMTLLDSWPPDDWTVVVSDQSFDSGRAPFSLTGPAAIDSVAFVSGNALARRYVVHIYGQDIPVEVPAHPDPKKHWPTVEQVAKGLAAMPTRLRAQVKGVQLDPAANPSDSYWSKVYGDPGFQSYMTAGADGIISIYPSAGASFQRNIDPLLIHEVGHVLSDRSFGPDADPRWKQWRDAMAADPLAPSGYGRSSAAEDFSETLVLYVAVRKTPEEAAMRWLFPRRFAVLDRLLAATKAA